MSAQPLHIYDHAAETPDKPALRIAATDLMVTFGELEVGSNRIAHLLRSFGLVSGDHLALLMENHSRFLQVCWAAQRSRLFYTPICTRLNADEVAYVARDCGAKAFITSRAMSDVAAELLHQLPDQVVRLMVDGAIEGTHALESLAAGFPPTRIPDASAGVDMLYSSGTTGRPKRVLRRPISTSIDSVSPSLRMLGLFGFDRDTVYLSPAPLSHAAPLCFCMGAQQLGGSVIVMEHFDAEEFLHLLQTHRVTHTQLVLAMFVRMLKLPPEVRNRYDLTSLRCAIHAAAPCPVPIKQQMIDWWGPIIWEYYAATEGNGLTLVNSADWQAHPGTVGRPVLGIAHICSPEGDDLPARATGLVYFADGPRLRVPQRSRQDAGLAECTGLDHSGDVGYLDGDGYLYLADRIAFTIISGGVNIYPQESESLLIRHPKVVDAAVFCVPNEEFGQEVKAVVQPRDMLESGPVLEQELIAFCQQRLSAIKCPRSIGFEEQLPRAATGKLHKQALRDRYWMAVQHT